jgi:hypothetical protein
MSCCTTNGCADIIASGCVRYTKEPIEFSTWEAYLSSDQLCDPSINDILGATDLELKYLHDYTLVAFDQITCATLGIVPSETSGSLVVKLANKICELEAELDAAKAAELNIWEQIVPSTLALQCLALEDCEEEMTLGLLIEKIITKIC